ncbi:MAG TPA: zf-HC2 domain-containing protein, partial [Pyrinomonadaceae bacterium]|nr:zf-HC2 domain-containing protein [Pyrinomonadaceae bacterium]
MKLSDEELRSLYSKETARRVRQSEGECLASEMLTLAAAGELSVPERELVADHLATCSDCAREYRSIRSLRSWAEDASKSLAPDSAAGPTPIAPAPFARPAKGRVAGFRPLTSYWPYAIAALLLLITLALAAQLISERRENQRLVAQLDQGQAPRGSVTTEPDSEIRKQLEAANQRATEAEAARRNAEEELAKRSNQNGDQVPTKPERG